MSEPTDEELLASHLEGDRQAFGQLVSRHERRVYGICLRMLGNREDAQDATQEAFLSALRRASTFRQAAAFSTWLYRIAVNAATDQGRRRGRARTIPLEPDEAGLPVPAGDPADPGDAVATAVTVQAALARVPDEFRAAVVLCDLLRLPYAEAAAVLGVPVGTVKSRVYRGRLALAGELRTGPAEEPRGGAANPSGAAVDVPVALAPGTGTLAGASEPVEADERRPRPSKE